MEHLNIRFIEERERLIGEDQEWGYYSMYLDNTWIEETHQVS